MRKWPLLTLLVSQLACALLFLFNILSTITGIGQLSWMVHELIELAAAIGLFLGAALGIVSFRNVLRRNEIVEDQLRVVSGSFTIVLDERFDAWNLTPAEKDVALFSIKGMNTAEIAELRNTSEGTVKSQTNAIYRKAGVSGRLQLLSLFVEEMIEHASKK